MVMMMAVTFVLLPDAKLLILVGVSSLPLVPLFGVEMLCLLLSVNLVSS